MLPVLRSKSLHPSFPQRSLSSALPTQFLPLSPALPPVLKSKYRVGARLPCLLSFVQPSDSVLRRPQKGVSPIAWAFRETRRSLSLGKLRMENDARIRIGRRLAFKRNATKRSENCGRSVGNNSLHVLKLVLK